MDQFNQIKIVGSFLGGMGGGRLGCGGVALRVFVGIVFVALRC